MSKSQPIIDAEYKITGKAKTPDAKVSNTTNLDIVAWHVYVVLMVVLFWVYY